MMNQTGLIYIADDEKEIRELIQKFLEEAGHKVEVFWKWRSFVEAI